MPSSKRPFYFEERDTGAEFFSGYEIGSRKGFRRSLGGERMMKKPSAYWRNEDEEGEGDTDFEAAVPQERRRDAPSSPDGKSKKLSRRRLRKR